MPTIAALPTITGEALEQLRILVENGIHSFNDSTTYDPYEVWALPVPLCKLQGIHDGIRALASEVTEITATTFPHDYVDHVIALIERGIDDADYMLDYSPAEIADLDPPLKERTLLHESILATVRTFR